MSKIFISYARSNVDFARELATSLSNLSVDVWLDVKDIPAGMKWSTAIQEGLNLCEVMLVIITPESMSSTNVEDEWQNFRSRNKTIIPILLEPANIHYRLEPIQYINFHRKDYNNAFEELCKQLERKGIKFNPISPPVPSFLPPPFEWCEVSAGIVSLEDVSGPPYDSGGKFRVESFYIAKYPITNAQYQVFIDDGYSDHRWWEYSDSARLWHKTNLTPQDVAFYGDDLPRTNLNWYDAMAFCQWVTAKLKLAGYTSPLGKEWIITLPTEQQWQRAAQGDKWLNYPWGDEFDGNDRCNTLGIIKLTPVAHYPRGASPYGVMDMVGNASEGCLDEGIEENMLPITLAFENSWRALRGGSFRHDNGLARCTVRSSSFPDTSHDSLGFRVCVSAPLA